ncbi:YqzM family protein [Paenibacillus aurantius]|uniref:YqzM family protein n=1 Tax=Paenibacillus aurantius TaxID=2918900 RepID=A0AA96LJI9_9BACL|nr:YqzM family protein [Paenibacillus aurantius]WJH32267.1 YqzM family protein [Paenibacillus sp. CC-CFT747]WNQ12647.1 YqzM family protein [Paenibacillus aurantius]
MNEPNHPELHVLEEPTNDFMDVAIGFGAMFGFLFLIGIIATIITLF